MEGWRSSILLQTLLATAGTSLHGIELEGRARVLLELEGGIGMVLPGWERGVHGSLRGGAWESGMGDAKKLEWRVEDWE